jgi:hypothetical protein
MTEEVMADCILDVIDSLGEATMPEIMDALGPEAKGDQDWTPWPETAPIGRGLSETAVDAFSSLWADIAPLSALEGDKNPRRLVRRSSLPRPDAAAIFNYIARYYRARHACLRGSKQAWAEADVAGNAQQQRVCAEQNSATSAIMMCLRDIGRYMLNLHPEDDSNPFGGPEDY